MSKSQSDLEQDFYDMSQGLQEDLSGIQLRIYRAVEAHIISAWKVVQQVQSHIIAQISNSLPSKLD